MHRLVALHGVVSALPLTVTRMSRAWCRKARKIIDRGPVDLHVHERAAARDGFVAGKWP